MEMRTAVQLLASLDPPPPLPSQASTGSTGPTTTGGSAITTGGAANLPHPPSSGLLSTPSKCWDCQYLRGDTAFIRTSIRSAFQPRRRQNQRATDSTAWQHCLSSTAWQHGLTAPPQPATGQVGGPSRRGPRRPRDLLPAGTEDNPRIHAANIDYTQARWP